MKLISFAILLMFMNSILLYDFSAKSKVSDWRIINDGVMGGESKGSFNIDENGYGVFQGTISLANSGGFSSVRYEFDPLKVAENAKIYLLLKGDKKDYQVRIKAQKNTYYSYIATFKTTGDWQEIVIPLTDFYPSYRGRKLPMANFSGSFMEEIVFLIGNGKNENFKLMLDKIELK